MSGEHIENLKNMSRTGREQSENVVGTHWEQPKDQKKFPPTPNNPRTGVGTRVGTSDFFFILK